MLIYGIFAYEKRPKNQSMAPRWSRSILTPIRTRMSPPASSARLLSFEPKTCPIITPAKEMAKVMIPIRLEERRMLTRKKAKVIPTASAFVLAVVLFQRLADHFPSDECQENKGDPMVDADDIFFKFEAKKPAQKGHQHLKSAEKEGYDRTVSVVQLFHFQTAADGYGKRIHSKSHGNKYKFYRAHKFLLSNELKATV